MKRGKLCFVRVFIVQFGVIFELDMFGGLLGCCFEIDWECFCLFVCLV